jgi:hypothetical protein
MTFDQWWEKDGKWSGFDKQGAELIWINAQAVERERCTRIAEGERVEDVGECDSAYNMAIDHVTAAIREGDA